MARSEKRKGVPVVTEARVAKTETGTPQQKRQMIVTVFSALFVLLVGATGAAGYFYYQYRTATAVSSEADEIAVLTKMLGAMLELPADETPTLATVMDKEKLASQPFFQKAENGDKVLIYTSVGRAILYRPSTKKIVDMTTVNVNTPAPTDAPQPSESVTAAMPAPGAPPDTVEKVVVQNVPIALYNGSTKVGATNTLEDEIKAQFDTVEVVTKDKAVKNDYQGNLVIDLSGSNADLAKSIAESFAGTVGTLPDGETAPAGTDILIIVGNKQ